MPHIANEKIQQLWDGTMQQRRQKSLPLSVAALTISETPPQKTPTPLSVLCTTILKDEVVDQCNQLVDESLRLLNQLPRRAHRLQRTLYCSVLNTQLRCKELLLHIMTTSRLQSDKKLADCVCQLEEVNLLLNRKLLAHAKAANQKL